MEDCIFCKITSGKVPSVKIWEDGNYFAFLDNNPVRPGHTLLVPKKHSDYVFDLSDGEYQRLMLTGKMLAEKLKSTLKPKRIGLIIEGFGVLHTHVHLIPINEQNELNPLLRKPATHEELEKIAKIINE